MKNISILLVAVFGFIYFLSCEKANATQGGMVTNNSKEEVIILEGYQIGDVVEDFSLTGVDGKTVSMANYPNAEGYIIVFTCNTCPYSKMYEDRIIALDKKYSNSGWPVIAINPNDPDVQPDDSYEKMQSYAKERNFKFPYAPDVGQKVYPKWGASRTPHVFIVSNSDKGKVLEFAGAIDDNARKENEVKENYVDLTISAIRNGKPVKPTTAKAIGCTIKTK